MVLKQCGDDLTRENVMKQAASVENVQLPMGDPGVVLNTSATDFSRSSKCRMQRFNGERWEISPGDDATWELTAKKLAPHPDGLG